MEEHVCIDREGHIRVWMNADLSKNYPEGYEEDGSYSRDKERVMTREVVELIEKNTEILNDCIPCGTVTDFFEIKGNREPTFREAV